MSRQPDNKVPLETLLRLKQAERPDGEFWAGFERELRVKQLAALVEKRSSWQAVPRFISRYAYLPLSAIAAFAFAFITVRHYRAPAPGNERSTGLTAAANSPSAPTVKVATIAPPKSEGIVPTQVSINRDTPSAPADRTTASEKDTAPFPAEVLATVPWLNGAISEIGAITKPPAVPLLASFEIDAAPLVRTEVRPSAKLHPAAEPLTQVAPPGEIRRARILAALADTHSGDTEPAAFTHTRERIASRLADENLADDISRLGVGGDRVSFKF